MKKYPFSITDLALPSPRIGSIDTYSGFGPAPKLAIKAHQKFQAKQHLEHPDYASEVIIQHSISFKRHLFHLTGRMDGVYQGESLRIEEIKTAFDPQKLIDVLADHYFTHPYWLQLQTYGYIHWLKTQTLPQLNLMIISLRNHKAYPLPLDLNIERFETWLDTRLGELVEEIKDAKRRVKRRQKHSTRLIFPFEQPRPQQKELMRAVDSAMKQKKPMLIQAPTGLGKTMGILYPALKESLSRGQKTIYITPKNTQHQIAVNTVTLLQSKGATFKSLVLTSKKKLCMKKEPVCTSKQCEFAQNHYTKCTEHDLLAKARKKNNLEASFFKELARSYFVCPYELQMACVPFADVVIGDYNYVFSTTHANSRVAAIALGETERPNLVIDEIHNLPSRSMDYFSPELNVSFFEFYLNALHKYPQIFQKKLIKIINQCIDLIHQSALPGIAHPHLAQISVHDLKQQEEQLNQFLSSYLESDLVIEENDPILKLCNYWSEFTAALEFVNQGYEEFFIFFHPQRNLLKISCCDASRFLKEHYLNFQQVIGFSATLKPFNYYSQLIGLNTPDLHTEEFASPFAPQNRKLLLIPQVSTKFKDRKSNIVKINEVITRIVSVKPGNYFVFFPSFEFLEQVFHQIKVPPTFHLLRQERVMSPFDAKFLLQKLQQREKHHLFFAVQGGMFAEGIDYVGDLAIGAFIIGPPLPVFDWERERRKEYYETHYQAGKEYAYIYPAMAKAIQAAGRVIRTENDRGLIVLLDNRFLHETYSQCMPKDWFVENPQELISKSILNDVSLFWSQEK